MSTVGQPERATQDRVITLFRDELGYRYLGDWTDRDGNSNIEEDLVATHLTKRGYDGWYTLEQDTILEDQPQGEGPVADVRTSADNLRSVLRSTG